MVERWLWLPLTAVIGTLLGGCANDGKIGTAPLSYMSSNAIETYEIYRAMLSRRQSNSPSGTFAYNPATGKTGYVVAWGRQDAPSRSIRKAIEYCGNSDSCKILDRDGTIVWKNISPELSQQLLAQNLDQKKLVPVAEEYKSSIFRVGYKQIQNYNKYLSYLKTTGGPNPNAAFFVSKDGENTGSTFSTGNDSYYGAINSAHRACVARSDQPCYLFGKGDKLVNADAEAAIK